MGKPLSYYSSEELKASFTAEAGHIYRTKPVLLKGKKWRLIIVDTNTGKQVQKVYIDMELIRKLFKEMRP